MNRAKIGQGKYCDIFLTRDGCLGCPVWTAPSPATGAPPCWAKDQRAVNYFFQSASKTVQRQPSVCKGVQPCDCASASKLLHGSNSKASSYCFFGDKTWWRKFLQKKSSEVFNKYVLYFVRKVCVECFFNASSCWTLLNKYVLNVVSGSRCVTTPNYWDQLLCCVHLAADRSGSVSAVVLVSIQNY